MPPNILQRRRRAVPDREPVVRLDAVATAAPPVTVSQAEALEGARAVFSGRSDEFERMAGVFGNAGIETRRSCVPVGWYLQAHGWPDRNGSYVENALSLLEDVARSCLDRAGLGASDIDVLLVVSSTGIATPSLDARLMERIPFRRDVVRLPVFGLGCAGGVLGFGRAAALARSDPGCRVLLMVVELCGLTFRRGDLSKSNIIATALFGDGAGGAILRAGEGAGGILAAGEYTWPNSLKIMGWSVEEDGLGVIFSRDIPSLVRTGLPEVAAAFLDAHGLSIGDLDGVICHPGGSKVLAALRDGFGLSEAALAVEADVLRRYGNMSAATVFFVLEEKLREAPPGRYLALALGPGFTAGFAVIDIP